MTSRRMSGDEDVAAASLCGVDVGRGDPRTIWDVEAASPAALSKHGTALTARMLLSAVQGAEAVLA